MIAVTIFENNISPTHAVPVEMPLKIILQLVRFICHRILKGVTDLPFLKFTMYPTGFKLDWEI